MPQIFQPFLPRKPTTIKTAHKIKAEKVLVMITVTWFTQLAKAMWNRTETISPPRMAAVILANRCQGDEVRYFLLAGIG